LELQLHKKTLLASHTRLLGKLLPDCQVQHKGLACGPFHTRCHGICVETSEGWIVYTGDLRLHGSKGNLTRAFFQEAAQLHPLLLITEGTHPEETNPVTEEQVKQRSMEVVAKTEGLVIAILVQER